MTRTKIICTIGPASGDKTTLRKMVLAGMDVVRLNFSHSTPTELKSRIAIIRRINSKYHRNIKILGDLEGPRIRIGRLKDAKPVELKKRDILWVTQDDIIGGKDKISFDYRGPLKDIKKGCHIYIDDGNIALEVAGHSKRCLKTTVLVGGPLKERKGVNIPEARLKFGPLSRKDLEDIRFCVKHKIDYIAQSFVRNKNDILKVRSVVDKYSGDCRIIAKIENREGVNNIDSIIAAADGIMVARGDMGVSLPIYKIPIIQKVIIKKCNRRGKFVITATQMLESMTENRIPTRAEVTDVANAVIDGTDYVMLSAETAVGHDPALVVKMMENIIKFTERYLYRKLVF